MIRQTDVRKFTIGLAIAVFYCICPELVYPQQYSEYASNVRRSHKNYDCNLLYTFWGYTDLTASDNGWIGRNDNVTVDGCEFNGRRWESFRMLYKWDLSSIPSNAQIKSAKIEFWYSSASDKYNEVTVTLRKYPLELWDAGHEQRWLQIAAGTAYTSRTVGLSSPEQYMTPPIEFFSGPLITDIQNSLPSNSFIFGVTASGDEEWTLTSGRTRFVNARQSQNGLRGVKLTINYTIPITVTVRNGIPNNGGTVMVDQMQFTSPYTTPTPWTSGTSHTIQSTTQEEGGTTYVPTGTWTNVTTGEVISQNPATVTPIQNTVFEANFTPTTATVTIDQRRESNSQLTGTAVGRWQGGAFASYTVPISPLTLNVGSNEVFKGHQEIVTSPNEKYNRWERNGLTVADVINHHNFAITYDLGSLTSRFKSIQSNITIATEIVEGGSGGTIEFKDPWLIDYADPAYGNSPRNRAMIAPFKSRTSPFYPDFTTSHGGDVYKGVFLNENPNLLPDQPVYSIRTPIVQTINGSTMIFQGWNYDPNYATVAQLEANPNGYDQKAVVFKQAGATIAARYSSTITTDVTIPSGVYSISSNLTVASGATLTISPGTTLNFTGPYKLRIEGKLIADGTPSSRITFTRSGGQWYGIEFYYNYGSGSSIQYADITNAQYGVSSYGTDTYLTNSKFMFNTAGVYVFGSINSMNWNLFENNTYGVQCANYGDANIQTNNVIRYNGWGVHGDWTSAPALGSLTGYNSLYYNDYYDVYSDYGGTIYAYGNWWGSYPAAPIVTPNVDYSSELSVDPNSWAGSAALTDGPTLEKSLQKASTAQGDTVGMNDLNQAYRLYLEESFENALAGFESIAEQYSNSFAGTRALVFADRIREKLSKDAKAALTEIANAEGESKVGILAKSLLVGRLVREGSYDQALTLAVDLSNDSDPLIARNAMFDAGNIAWYKLNDKTKGMEYFERLIVAYPEHPESFSAQTTLGTWEPKPTERGTESAKEALVTELSLQSYPNPFNPATEIRFAIPEEGLVTLRIFDVLGRVIATLVNENRQAGPHSVRWDASHVPSGVYFSRLEASGRAVVSRLLLVR